MQQKHIQSIGLSIFLSIFSLLSFMTVFSFSSSNASAQRFTSSSSETKCEVGENPPADKVRECIANNGIVKVINTFIALVAGVAGIVITGMIIAGGIQYSAAGGNQASVEKAKKRIGSAVLALLAFMFLGAFLEWLVPGGLIR